ncbi:unnamed protein product [Protopolystoma xenopodis]|uniref:Receptor ligand binding region domain-containing protein n=1 Tax=Protopolystoma xenopodis TaxID=117903 RepID=A0A448WHP5_9PLAT|nr:unnamed protein product [Protopolystoma xenopodis]
MGKSRFKECTWPDKAVPPDYLAEIKREFTRVESLCRNISRNRVASVTAEQIRLGVQLPSLVGYTFSKVLPAFDILLDKLASTRDFSRVSFTIVPILFVDYMGCDCLAVLDHFRRDSIDVLFGPIPDFQLSYSARISTAMFVRPVLVPSGFTPRLSDKREYGMLTRTLLDYSDLNAVFTSTFSRYGWLNEHTPTIGLFKVEETTHYSTIVLAEGLSTFFNSMRYNLIEQQIKNKNTTFSVLPLYARGESLGLFSSFDPTEKCNVLTDLIRPSCVSVHVYSLARLSITHWLGNGVTFISFEETSGRDL